MGDFLNRLFGMGQKPKRRAAIYAAPKIDRIGVRIAAERAWGR